MGRAIPESAFRDPSGGFNAGGPGSIKSEYPGNQVEHMGTAVANLSSAEIQHPAKVSMAIVGVVRSPRGGSEPHIPIQMGGRLCRFQGIAPDGIVVVPAFDSSDAADIAFL